MIQEFAPAKINLGLAVTGQLENGYHSLDTLFATLNLGDSLSFLPIETGIELEVRGADLPATRDNLVYRAAEAYLEAAGQPGGVRIALEKHLPIAAGLGGGSSDAAATLRGLQRLYPASLHLESLAVRLGADVTFLIHGGAARASGIGERLEPLRLPETHLVLANPGVGISAREAYAGLRGRFGPPLPLKAIIAALSAHTAPPYRNDLEVPVLEAYPVVHEVQTELRTAGLHGVLMSGSGSTCFGLARDQTQALSAAARIKAARPEWWVRAAQTR